MFALSSLAWRMALPTPTVLEATKRLQVLHVALARDGFERFLCVRSCEVNNVKHY